LGREGQARLSAMRVAIVGLGGTGSQVAQQLAHLGVRDLILVDDDRVELSNLPRLAGATWWSASLRSKKTAVAARAIRRFTRSTRIRRLGSLRSRESLNELSGVDLLVGCVDNDGARLIMTELAAANLTPYLDIGVSVEVAQDGVAMGGRVGFYLPGGPCLACMDELDLSEAAQDLESEALHGVRLERGYTADRQVEPALMPLNTVLVGTALLELLAFATGVRNVQPYFRFDAIGSRIVLQRGNRNPDCPVCGPAYAAGDRQDVARYALERRSNSG